MEPDSESARICIGVIIQNLRQTRDHGVLRLVDQLPVSYRTLMADVRRCNVRSSGHIGLVAGPPQACSFPTFCRVSALRRLRLWGHDRVCEIAEVDERSFLAIAYTPDSEWRNRSEFPRGRRKIIEILTRKWQRDLDYRLRKELWAFTGNRVAVRFEYQWHDAARQWFRSHGNENWEFAPNGLMQRRYASIDNQPISEAERKFR